MQSDVLRLSRKQKISENKKAKEFFKYFVCALALIVASFASVNFGDHKPFAFGLYFALIMMNLNIYAISGLYFGASVLSTFTFVSALSALNVVLFGIIIYFIYKRVNKSKNRYVFLAVALLSNATYIYFTATTAQTALTTISSVGLGLLFSLACMHFFQATIAKGFSFKLSLDETIAGSVALIVFSMGLSALSFEYIETIKIFAIISILIATYVFPKYTPMFIGVLIGIGAGIHTQNIAYIASFSMFALISILFKSNTKIFAVIAIILCEIVLGLYFQVYNTFTVYSIISIIVAEIIFMCLPAKAINSIGDLLGGVKEKVAIRNIVNHTKEGVFSRMNQISNVFGEMESVFRTMAKGELPIEDAKKMLVSEVIEKVSKENDEINKLLRKDSKTTVKVFSEIVDIGFERGRITLLDVPQYITSRIGRVNYLINTVNQLLSSYKHYSVMVNNMDTSRLIIADQLGGVSTILKNLAEEVKTNITFDQNKEIRIIEDLSYKNILCVEAIVYEENSHKMIATIVLKELHFNEQVVEKVVSKIVGSNMGIIDKTPSSVAGCMIITMHTKPNHNIIFGSASAGKTGEMVSGDTHSLIQIDDGKFMLALADGMGSGKIANQTSALAISLIENFYKAGFENEMILNSVNKLLAQNAEENFSALDVCVIDVRKGIMDFIKLASPNGYIKQKNTTEIVESGGLPMGILEEMKPNITKKVITPFDIVVLLSDGITDSFSKNKQNLQEYINNLETTNPQTISDMILDRAVDLNNGVCYDDMTVVAVRIYPLQ